MSPQDEKDRDPIHERFFRSARANLKEKRAKADLRSLTTRGTKSPRWSEATLGLDQLLLLDRCIRAKLKVTHGRQAPDNVVQFLTVDGHNGSDLAHQFAHAVNTKSSKSLLLLSDNEKVRSHRSPLRDDPRKRSWWEFGASGPALPNSSKRKLEAFVKAPLEPIMWPTELGPAYEPPKHWEKSELDFDLVVIDSEMSRADVAFDIAMEVGGTVLVVEDQTRRRKAIEVREAIELAGGNILGVVLLRERLTLPDWLEDILA